MFLLDQDPESFFFFFLVTIFPQLLGTAEKWVIGKEPKC